MNYIDLFWSIIIYSVGELTSQQIRKDMEK